jgi:hypothetical protein
MRLGLRLTPWWPAMAFSIALWVTFILFVLMEEME